MANFHQNNTPCYASSSSSSSSRRMDSLWSIQSILCLFSLWEDWYISLALIQYPLRIFMSSEQYLRDHHFPSLDFQAFDDIADIVVSWWAVVLIARPTPSSNINLISQNLSSFDHQNQLSFSCITMACPFLAKRSSRPACYDCLLPALLLLKCFSL